MLGEELKRRREELGISLGEISEATRIGTRFLKAIEADNYAALPGGIFTRSFIRAYAKEVGMDGEVAVARYQTESGAAEPAAADTVEPEPSAGPFVYDEPSHTFWPSVLLATAAALVLGSGGWALNHYLNRPDEPDASAAVGPAAEAPAPTAAVPAASAPSDNLTVTLLGTGTCWIKYAVDGGDPTQLVLKEGDSRRIAAAEKIDLSVGNTRAVELRINERDVRFPENTPIVLKKITITPDTVASQFN